MLKKLLQSTFQLLTQIFLKDIKKDKLIKKTIALYKNNDFTEFFVIIRFWDAPFTEIKNLVPKKGTIVDLGSGDGLLSNYLALDSRKRNLIGIEINKSRHQDANKNLTNTKFIHGDVLKSNIIPKADCILMTHLLHHLPTKADQEKLIKSSIKSLKPNGTLIITEVSQKPFYKYIISWLTDAFIVPIIFENKLYDFSFNYRAESDWLEILKKEGLKVISKKAHKGKPFSHIIFKSQLF